MAGLLAKSRNLTGKSENITDWAVNSDGWSRSLIFLMLALTSGSEEDNPSVEQETDTGNKSSSRLVLSTGEILTVTPISDSGQTTTPIEKRPPQLSSQGRGASLADSWDFSAPAGGGGANGGPATVLDRIFYRRAESISATHFVYGSKMIINWLLKFTIGALEFVARWRMLELCYTFSGQNTFFRYGKIYVKAAKSCMKKGSDYAKNEIQRLDRMLAK